MIAAIYARKSTDQNGIVTDEQKSVTRQVDHARAFALEQGWVIAEDHIYVDDGVSGAEFANRPGLVRLLNAVGRTRHRTPPFQVLIVSDFDRLGRESIETPYVLKQIVSAGVRVFSYLDRQEIKLDSPIATMMMQVQAFGAALEREKARQRTIDAMVRKARHGHVTGGRVFGYDNVDVMTDQLDKSGRPLRSHVTRRVNEAEAAVVCRMFQLAAKGIGQLTIAKLLNEEGAPSPQSQRGRPRGWAQSSVHEVLFRESYRGELIWNRTRKRDAFGQANRSDRDEREWIRVPAPALRIVSDDLWKAAHRRLEESRRVYMRGTDGKLWGRPLNGTESKYLLSGFLACAKCGANLDVESREHGKKRAHFYSCSTNIRRGKAVCAERLLLPMQRADAVVLGWFERELLQPAVVERVYRGALARYRQKGRNADGVRNDLRERITNVEGEMDRLADAIAAGGEDAPDVLLRTLRARERRRQELQDDLRHLEIQSKSTLTDPELRRRFDAATQDWQAFLHQGIPQARQLIRKLVRERITVEFTPQDGQPGWRLKADSVFDKLFAQVLPEGFAQALASPAGPEAARTSTDHAPTLVSPTGIEGLQLDEWVPAA